MDDELSVVLLAHNGDDLEQRAAPVGAEVQPEVVVEVLDHDCVLRGMLDVVTGEPVLERRRQQIHTRQSYYETSVGLLSHLARSRPLGPKDL